MPLGDPMGGEYDDSDIVRITGIPMVRLFVSNLESAIVFYTEVLNLSVLRKGQGRCHIACGPQELILEERADVKGGETGIFLSTPSIYDVQKRLADMPVTILQPPMRREDGLMAVIMDQDGNVLNLIEV